MCHADDGGAADGSSPYCRRLDTLGIAYKSLRTGPDGAFCLNLSGTPITNLAPLTELPITHLCLQGCYGISDFSPLREMRLLWLNLCRSKMLDLSALSRQPLSYLDLRGTRTADLRPLATVPLASLDIRFTRIEDVSSIRRMPLANLAFHPNRIRKGLRALAGMRTLKTINRQPAAEFWTRHSATLNNGHSAP